MGLLKLSYIPDDVLKTPASPVTEITPQIKQLGYDMLDTMYYNNGIGLAANQVGVLKRVIVVDVEQHIDKITNSLVKGTQYIMINPEVLEATEMGSMEEGCLSVPQSLVKVSRPTKITARYMDLDGKIHTIEACGLFAVCIQHEIDHINGITIDTYAGYTKRQLIVKRVQKYVREQKPI